MEQDEILKAAAERDEEWMILESSPRTENASGARGVPDGRNIFGEDSLCQDCGAPMIEVCSGLERM